MIGGPRDGGAERWPQEPRSGGADFQAALDAALEALRAGVPIEECVARSPAFAGELRPLLEMAAAVARAAPLPTITAAAQARVRTLVVAQARTRLAAKRPWWHRARPAQWGAGWVAVAAAAALLALGGSGTLVAAASTLPGEPLYGVKRSTEDARVAVVRTVAGPDTQVQLYADLAGTRLQEVVALTLRGQPVPDDLVVAAKAWIDAAEAVVARTVAPQQAQVAQQLTNSLARQDAAVELTIRAAPAPAQTAIARAVSQGTEAGRTQPPGAPTVRATPGAGDESARATPPPGAGAGAGAAPAPPAPGRAAQASPATGQGPLETLRAAPSKPTGPAGPAGPAGSDASSSTPTAAPTAGAAGPGPTAPGPTATRSPAETPAPPVASAATATATATATPTRAAAATATATATATAGTPTPGGTPGSSPTGTATATATTPPPAARQTGTTAGASAVPVQTPTATPTASGTGTAGTSDTRS